MDCGIRHLLSLSVGFLALSAGAWGAGHSLVIESVLEKAPEEFRATWKDEWKDRIVAASHGPDGGKLKMFSDDDRAWFAAKGFRETSGDLHQPEIALAYYARLVHALRTGDDLSAWGYLAFLSHLFADDVAANHDPLAHMAIYIWGESGLKIVPSGVKKTCDLGFCADDTAAAAEYRRQLSELKVPELPSAPLSPLEVFERTRRFADESSVFAASNGLAVVSSVLAYEATHAPEDAAAVGRSIAPLGLAGVERTLEILQLARAAAKVGDVEIPGREELKARRLDWERRHAVDSRQANRKLADEAVAAAFLPRTDGPNRIRIAYDPTGHMRGGVFGPAPRALAPLLAGSLKAAFAEDGVALVDCHEIVSRGLDSQSTQVLIVYGELVCGWLGFDTKAFRQRLADYLKAGGRIIWIGGKPPRELAPDLAAAVTEIANQGSYGKPPFPAAEKEDLMASRVVFDGVSGPTAFSFKRFPGGAAGWFWMGCRTVFDAAKLGGSVRPLVTFRTGEGKEFLQGVLAPRESPSFAYLPGYAVFPYYFTDEKPTLKPFSLRLDGAAEKMIVETVKLLK